jgi:FkbH-like protein
MGSELYRDLKWLQPPPKDFKQRCADVSTGTGRRGEALRSLAQYQLDGNQLVRLAKCVNAASAADPADLTPLLSIRVGVLSDATSDFVVQAIISSGLRYGLAVDVVTADYNQVLQSALDPGSSLYARPLDAVLLALDYRGLHLNLGSIGNREAADAQVESALTYINTVRAGIHANSTAICMVQTIVRPPETLFGNADRAIAGTWIDHAQSFNRRLAESLDGGDVLVDAAALAETVGLANWHDAVQWNLAKLPFALEYLPLYADHVCRVLGALKGKSRKTLVLDLDNTVWSGVIGDDGLDGIVIGQGDATGEAHLELQSYALALRSRGVVLAVSSKNDDAVARLPFQKHPDMLLREDHFAVFQANWSDKATNLASIAQELALGVDALTFVDDNPFERNLVRGNVSSVAVPELPSDPALYTRTVAAAGYFEALTLSAEDRKRAEFYQDNARRVALQQQVGNLEEYLASLEMEITFGRFDSVTRSRVTQLINKSNQFNLTTQRYTEAEVAKLESDANAYGIHVRLKDKFGDNGIISVIICLRDEDDWVIDTWLMSCRVLGRRVESAVLRELLQAARSRGIKRLIGRYRPTERNAMVRDHYLKLGFSQLREDVEGETVWEMDCESEMELPIPMTVHSEDAAEEVAAR